VLALNQACSLREKECAKKKRGIEREREREREREKTGFCEGSMAIACAIQGYAHPLAPV